MFTKLIILAVNAVNSGASLCVVKVKNFISPRRGMVAVVAARREAV